jgi:hypothetical protein
MPMATRMPRTPTATSRIVSNSDRVHGFGVVGGFGRFRRRRFPLASPPIHHS